MGPRYDAVWIADLMDVRGRLGETTTDEFLFQLGLHRGHAVVDVGCGPGLFTLAAAGMVGRSGWVHAVDVNQEMLDLVNREAESQFLVNVFTVRSDGGAVPLQDQAGDFVMCMQALHYGEGLEGQADMVRDLARLVRPPGTLVIVNWKPDVIVNWKPEMSGGPLLRPDAITEILQERGFECDGPNSFGERHDMVVARRVEGERMTVRRPAHGAAHGG